MGRKVMDGARGRTGRVFYDGSELCVESWDLEITAEEGDMTNSCSQGWGEVEYGVQQGSGTVEAQWDITANPHDAPPGLAVGEIVQLQLFIHSPTGTASGPNYRFQAGIASIKTGVTAKQKVMYSFTYKSDGPIVINAQEESSGV